MQYEDCRVLVAGDWHGNTRWACRLVDMADRYDAKTIVQVGDFGLWDHTESGIRYLDTLNEACRRHGVKVIWLDGNHENHASLAQHRDRGPWDYHGHLAIRSHIRYSPRGNRFWLGNRHCMTVGGAVSIDRYGRVDGHSWWVDEQLTEEQVMLIEMAAQHHRETDQPPIDYLFTHDCPTNAPFRHRLKEDLDSHIHRQRMDRVGRAVRPRLWFHGHMHERYEYTFRQEQGESTVIGFDCDGEPYNWGILIPAANMFVWGPKIGTTRRLEQLIGERRKQRACRMVASAALHDPAELEPADESVGEGGGDEEVPERGLSAGQGAPDPAVQQDPRHYRLHAEGPAGEGSDQPDRDVEGV